MAELNTKKYTPVNLKQVFNYLTTGITALAGSERSNFIKCCKKFTLKDGKLMYTCTGAQNTIIYKQVLLEDSEKQLVFCDVHASSQGSHVGINNTIRKISERFYWIGIKADVKKWIAQCDVCQKCKVKTVAPVLQPIKTYGPWEMLGIDLIGPLPQTSNGNKYILTVTDLWSKYIEAFALKNKSAAEICTNLQTLFYRYGAPEKILTDQGREFCNTINERLFKMFKVKHLCRMAYPQTNGQDERTNQTIKRTLSKLVNEKQNDWDQHLEAVLFAWRTTTQVTTKFTPFFLMFNREPRFISEPILNEKPEEEPLSFVKDVTESDIKARIDSFQHLKRCVDDNISTVQEKIKKYH